eukprot:TRINITY_DN13_c0_g1_i6.p1 TRINITY_DN13_c0_g1~~TRINITY_DN13_c0_g1_i6.p1  ORF type:complete len:217 (-),score=28.94 TRINITY_DN13_c0_g1_i6:340-990(-)
MKFLICLLLLCLFKINQAVIGVDVSELYSSDTYNCMAANDAQFAIIRGYCSYGGVDDNAVQSLQNAGSAGLITDVYFFPCIGGKDASDQVSEFQSAIPQSLFGMVWVDVETNPSSGCEWSSDINYNCNFLSELVNDLQGAGFHVGIYASYYQWDGIFGDPNNCPYFTGNQLWYAHYDYNPSFDDFTSFAGWNSPNIKQYQGGTGFCGANVDMDYYP